MKLSVVVPVYNERESVRPLTEELLRVLRGLGHGLDEAAVNAANKIKFKPAQRNGSSVDSTAVVHVLFQLAS